MAVIKPIPRLTRREITPPGEPVTAGETYNGTQGIPNLVDDQDRRIRQRCTHRCLMKHHHLRELCEEQLLLTSTLSTLFTFPIGNDLRPHGLADRIRYRLLFLAWSNRELVHRVPAHVCIVAVVALDDLCDLEPCQLVKDRDLVTEKLNQLM